MFKSSYEVFGSVAFSAMLLSAGATIAADAPTLDSINSQQLREIVAAQDQVQNREQEQARQRLYDSSGAGSGEKVRNQVQTREHKQYETQTKSYGRSQMPGSGSQGMSSGGHGRSGGGRR
ncbi:MAG: hypothetical protein LJE59_07130 [Chromatiaceae bacterium]|nr:hypothetical protein [Chromatiaceae bacterium]